jgi:glycosyltransferase involved in cell wall biosynthesis
VSPKLTIGIPTFNRPEFLPKALRSALGQNRPVRVIVTDNGDSAPTEGILASEEFKEAGITYIKTTEPGAWPNWRAAAEACETEYFAWLQDDDVVRNTYADRIIDVMDYFPDVNCWMARLACAYSAELGMPYKGNCPLVPMDLLSGKPARWMGGEIIAATSYVTSWSLCPALAYRNNARFREALRAMPVQADIFIERLMPAYVSVGAPIVADPIIAGYWVQHTRMLHLAQNADIDEARIQINNSFATLDTLMDEIEASGADWRQALRNWLGFIPFDHLKGWMDGVKPRRLPPGTNRGRYLDEVLKVLVLPGIQHRRMLREMKSAMQLEEVTCG